MGIFGRIQNAVRDAQERAALEAKPAVDRMMGSDIIYATEIFYRESRRATSIAMRANLISGFRRRLAKEENNDELYRAFMEVYQLYEHKRDNTALAISQIIGKKLYENDYWKIKVETVNDKDMYLPKNSWY